jgi:hypothetical protein
MKIERGNQISLKVEIPLLYMGGSIMDRSEEEMQNLVRSFAPLWREFVARSFGTNPADWIAPTEFEFDVKANFSRAALEEAAAELGMSVK